jgi:hypothetical protein
LVDTRLGKKESIGGFDVGRPECLGLLHLLVKAVEFLVTAVTESPEVESERMKTFASQQPR